MTNQKGFTPHLLRGRKVNIALRHKKGAGFTLLESTIAIIVLIVGIFAITQFFPFSLRIIGHAQSTTVASNLALSKIEELSSLNYDNIIVGTIEAKTRLSADQNDYLYNYERQTIVSYLDANLNDSATDVGFKKITVTVFWVSLFGNKEKSIEINTIITDY